MTRTWLDGDPIAVQTDAADRPQSLHWRGLPHRVAHIVEMWEVRTDWWESAGELQRAYYALITTDDIFCVVYRDLGASTWHLASVYD